MHNNKLDSLLAEMVLGWKNENGWVEYGEKFVGGKSLPVYDFRPSVNIKDAWLIVEKFWHIEIEKENGIYYVCIHTGTTDPECENGSELIYFAESNSAPLAICLAALQSVGD